MILLLDRRTVIITPPKTASDTLHRVFCSGLPWNGQGFVGQHHGVIDKHYPRVPLEAHGFKVLLTVRHPGDRLVSLWHHKRRLEGYEGHGSESFEAFCRRLMASKVETWLWKTTIAQLVGGQHIDGLLHVERLAEDLAANGLTVEALPRHNAEWRQEWPPRFFTPELLELVKPWASEDCERYGYEWPTARS